MKGHSNRDGQISMDFLTGIAIFLVTFTFIIQIVPVMFTPFQGEETDLHPVAYRTSVMLVEDPGWWDDSTANGSDWENYPINVTRIGWSDGTLYGNRVDALKINATLNMSNSDPDRLRECLGLRTSYKTYYYNITFINPAGVVVRLDQQPVTMGDPIPDNMRVERVTRLARLYNAGIDSSYEGNIGSIKGGDLSPSHDGWYPHNNSDKPKDEPPLRMKTPIDDFVVYVQEIPTNPGNHTHKEFSFWVSNDTSIPENEDMPVLGIPLMERTGPAGGNDMEDLFWDWGREGEWYCYDFGPNITGKFEDGTFNNGEDILITIHYKGVYGFVESSSFYNFTSNPTQKAYGLLPVRMEVSVW